MRVMTFFLLAAFLGVFQCPSPAYSADYYVQHDGDDGDPGSLAAPFASVQRAADLMKPGDTCYVRGGIYREGVSVRRSGRKNAPIRFCAYPGEVVTFSGTEVLKSKWQLHKGAVYKTKVPQDFEQLFVDGEMMVEARWPNMRMDEVWDRSKWAKAGKGSHYGVMKDPELAETGIDWSGALATLNVTHQFYTWTRFVTNSEPGSDYFEYPKDFGRSTEMRYGDKAKMWEDDRYYLSGKLEALDAPTEWHLDRDEKMLYLWAKDGGNPAGKHIEYKVRDYSFVAENSDYIELSGFHFFGATFSFKDSNHCIVDGCHLLYPSYSRELKEMDRRSGSSAYTRMSGDFNVFKNSSIGYSSTQGIALSGRQNLVENNIVHDVCWNGSLKYTAIQVGLGGGSKAPKGGVVRGNTVFNCGNAIIGYRSQPYDIEYNHVYNGGLACKDVALIYTGQPSCAGSVVRYNWVHGCRTEEGRGLGIRGDDQTRRLTVHNNVVWDCGRDGIIVKGDFNKVHNNTVMFVGKQGTPGNYIVLPTRTEPTKAWRQQHPLLEKQNFNSQVYNNAARTISGDQHKVTPFPWEKNLANNYQGGDLMLRDVRNWDFMPAKASPLIDAGREIEGFTEGHAGKAPDIGAYEYGGKNWKPGHRNGVHISKAALARQENKVYELSVALTMPIFDDLQLRISSNSARLKLKQGQNLTFTHENWMLPQKVTLVGETAMSAREIALTVTARNWGSIKINGLNVNETLHFPDPHLGKITALDEGF